MKNFNDHVFLQTATGDATDGVFAEVVVGGESGDKELGAFALVVIDLRCGNVVNDRFENDVEIRVEIGGFAGATLAGDGVVNRIVELRLVGGELKEQIRDFVFHFFDAGGRFVDFIDDDDGFELEVERFLEDEFSLWHWTLLCVNNEEDAVCHIERAFNFAGEVGVTWSVDDVDFIAVVKDRGLLRRDGDAAFVFLVARVHNESLRHFRLIVAESVRLFQKPIDERGLAVIDVSNNGDISDFILVHNGIF